jgi:hypothetical protein
MAFSLAFFALPKSALQCAQDVMADAQAMGIPVRAGVHTREVLVQAPDVIGIAVHAGELRQRPGVIDLPYSFWQNDRGARCRTP